MTVAELMTELAKWPPDLEVLVYRYRWSDLFDEPATRVERTPDGVLIAW